MSDHVLSGVLCVRVCACVCVCGCACVCVCVCDNKIILKMLFLCECRAAHFNKASVLRFNKC